MYRGYSLQSNSVDVLKDIIVYYISSITKNEVNIEILQGEEFSLFPFYIFALMVLSHV